MAGTMPHAVFVETDWDGAGGVAAYAAELPGCATFARSAEEAVAAIPFRVGEFVGWLNSQGDSLPTFAGGSWYEVERKPASRSDGAIRRASFSLDELPPSEAELARYLRWLELAREELAEALDRSDPATAERVAEEIARQDGALARELGGDPPADDGDPIDRLFSARDHLSRLLETLGAAHDGARRVLRLAIADDLRAAAALRGSGR